MLKVFNEYKDEMIKEFGRVPMYDSQIKKYGKAHIHNFGGVFPHDKFNPQDNRCYIINTSNSKGPGYHWVGVVATDKYLYLFDSFRRDPDSIFHTIERFQEDRIITVSKSKDPVQKDTPEDSNICGQLSLAWLLTVQHYGVRSALQI
mgnify:CR=1 FL=1